MYVSTFESVEWLHSLWPLTHKLTLQINTKFFSLIPGANFHPTCHLFAIPCLSGIACTPSTRRKCWTELKSCYVGLQTGRCIPNCAPTPVPCDTLLVLWRCAYLELFVCSSASGVAAISKQPWHWYPGSAMVAVNEGRLNASKLKHLLVDTPLTISGWSVGDWLRFLRWHEIKQVAKHVNKL